MTDITRVAVIGTDAANVDAKAFLAQVTVHGLQQAAGYVADVLTDRQVQEYRFSRNRYGVMRLDLPQCEKFQLGELVTMQVVESVYQEFTVRYSSVLVFRDFVLLCWKDADTSDFEWAHLEVTRDALIELWESDEP